MPRGIKSTQLMCFQSARTEQNPCLISHKPVFHFPPLSLYFPNYNYVENLFLHSSEFHPTIMEVPSRDSSTPNAITYWQTTRTNFHLKYTRK